MAAATAMVVATHQATVRIILRVPTVIPAREMLISETKLTPKAGAGSTALIQRLRCGARVLLKASLLKMLVTFPIRTSFALMVMAQLLRLITPTNGTSL